MALALTPPRLSRTELCAKLVALLGQLQQRRRKRGEQRKQPARPPSDALRALCAGAMTVEEYLLFKLDAALLPLTPLLRPDDLAKVRAAMSERISTEPMWRAVVEELRSALARQRVVGTPSDDR